MPLLPIFQGNPVGAFSTGYESKNANTVQFMELSGVQPVRVCVSKRQRQRQKTKQVTSHSGFPGNWDLLSVLKIINPTQARMYPSLYFYTCRAQKNHGTRRKIQVVEKAYNQMQKYLTANLKCTTNLLHEFKPLLLGFIHKMKNMAPCRIEG